MRDGWLSFFKGGEEARPNAGAGAAPVDIYRYLGYVVAFSAVTTYILFSKKLLPVPVSRVVAKIYFWPTMPFTLLSRWDNYWTKMDDMIYLGGAPMSVLGHIGVLEQLGIKGVVNLCDEYGGPTELYKRAGIKQLWLPTIDHTEPSLETINKALNFMEEFQAQAGDGNDGTPPKVLVHCKSGHGRSAAVVMSWLLMQDREVTPRQVQAYMLSKRSVRKTLFRQQDIREFYKELLETDINRRGKKGSANGNSNGSNAAKDKRTRGMK